MMDSSIDKNASVTSVGNSILYELLVYSEWKQEPELPKRPQQHQEGLRSLLRSALNFQDHDAGPEQVERLLNWQQPWRLCVGDGGKVVAIMQDGSLEIRSSRDEYSSVIAKASLPKDPFLQWRRWCWSPDCSILAVGFSNGSVRAYDLMGSNLFSIAPEQSFSNTSHSFASAFFLQARAASHKWSSELVTVNYSGQLHSYLVSPTEGFQENHSFSFSTYYRFGITAVAYHPKHPMLFVAGPIGSRGSLKPQEFGDSVGLTTWRILNDHPFYQIVHHDKKNESTSFSNGFWQIPFFGSKQQQSIVIRLEISPCAKRIAALHSCGGVSIWSLPGIKLIGFWPLVEQPDWNIQNPLLIEPESPNSKRSPVTRTQLANESFYPVDLDWWSDEAIVLSRNSGSVSVCEISNLQNLLGESPEFLAGSAQVKRFHSEKGFLALECEVDVFCKSRNSEETFEEDSGMEFSDDDDEDEVPTALFQRVVTLLNSVAYIVTDLERFRPKRRRLRLCRRTYRLLALRSTTPEELYSRKLDNEEYGDALTLAHTYNLDCDHVYQRQWRNSKVTVATIREYLSKVSNQTWVLRECLDRVPESLLATCELIEFGLKATSKEVFRTLGAKHKIKDREDMTDNQREFLCFRHTLLRYQDRLIMYEKILGSPQLADELFEHSVYADFRSSSSLRACVLFARAANCQAVECMLTYQGSQTLNHWLPILSNFPETVCPSLYKTLLPVPELSPNGIAFSWQEAQLREPDWSEKEPYWNVMELELDTPDSDNKWLYEHEPGLSAYRVSMSELTPELVQQWYLERIRAIERSSRMVDNALMLLRIAQDNNVKSLESLHEELQILDALVYELFLEDVSLADLEIKSSLEKCNLLMSKTTDATFISDMNRLLFPFLDRVEKDHPGMKLDLLHDYIVAIATEDLSLPLKFFEEQEEISSKLSPDEVASIAVDCIYAYTETDQLHLAQNILAAIPVQRVLSVSCTEQLHLLEQELAASLILHHNQTSKSLGYIRDNKNDSQTVTQLLTRMARTAANSNSSLSEAAWASLLSDILDLQRSIFNCVPLPMCYEIFCSTLLMSGSISTIKLATNYLNCSMQTRDDTHSFGAASEIPKEKCIALVLSAAREYMDSAGTLTDPAMELARACLYLMPIENEDIQEEKNLLSAFQLLHEFGIKMLPLQVRLCPDRLRIIEDCLKKKSGAHRNPSKLLQLASYLNICGENSKERQGRVLVLVAEAAFSANDFHSCADTCNRFVAANYTSGWSIASKLSQCKQFKDLSTRAQLLSFALQHCPSEMLQELVDIRRSLEIESLQQVVKKQITMHNSSLSMQLEGQVNNPQSDSYGMDVLESLQTAEASVQETTQRLLSCVGDSQFWKKALRIGWDESVENETIETANSTEHHACHAFYSSLYESTSYCMSKLGYQYDCFSAPDIPPQLQLEQALLRISLLEQESGIEQLNLPNVLSECALSLLPEDNCLGLGHLLAAPETYAREASHQVFEANMSAVSLQLAQYYAAIMWYRYAVNGDVEKMHSLFLYNPHEVISLALQAKCESDDGAWRIALLGWRKQLADYVQAQDLLTLDCGVDVNRFASDDQYRHDSILGLAMSEDTERLRFALALAARHGVDRGEVIAEHISNHLLSGMADTEVKSRLSCQELCSAVTEAPEAVKEKLESSVFSNIDGKQINLLELYYTVLNQVAPSHRSARLLPKDHLKLLSKVKATCAAIDYKLLISGPKFTLKAVESSLTFDNIPLVAKLLKAMAMQSLATPLSTSQLYALHLKCQLLASRSISLEKLAPVLANIKAKDIMEVVEKTCFCDATAKPSVSFETAEQLIAAALLNCDFSEFAEGVERLAIWKDHIRSSRWLTERWPEEEYCKRYFATNGENGDLVELLKAAVLNEEKSAALLVDLFNTISSACSTSEESLMLDILRSCVNSSEIDGGESYLELSTILLRLEQLVPFGKIQATGGEWESLLQPLATKETLPTELRLKIFNILQQTNTEAIQEPTLLLSHSQAILALSWPSISISNEDIVNEDKRVNLFLNLTKNTASWQQRDALRNLLDLWPAFTLSSDNDNASKIYMELLQNCVFCENGIWTEQKSSYIVDICNRHPVSYHSLEQFLSEVQSKSEDSTSDDDENEDDDSDHKIDVQLLILVCLLCDDKKAHRKAVSLAQKDLMEPFHDKVAELAQARELTVDLLSTPAYSELLSSTLASQPSSAESIVKTLIGKKHIPEAGSVLLRSINSVPHFMRTFSASFLAGLGQTSCTKPFANEMAISRGNKSITQSPRQSSVTPPPSSTRAANPSDNLTYNEWDTEETEWNDVEEPEAKHVEEIPHEVAGSFQHKSQPGSSHSLLVVKEPKSDFWGAGDGGDDVEEPDATQSKDIPLEATRSFQNQSPSLVVVKESKSDSWGRDDGWDDIDESEATQSKEIPHELRSSIENQSQPGSPSLVVKESKSDSWGADDGWDNWSEEEVEKITKGREKESHRNVKKCVTPPLLPSPQSAFARVPPRDQKATNVSAQTQANPEPQSTDLSNAASDWGDDNDWNTDW